MRTDGMVRDPRKDPMPGDVTIERRKPDAWVSCVLNRNGKFVTYWDGQIPVVVTVSEWQEWVKDSEVAYVAG